LPLGAPSEYLVGYTQLLVKHLAIDVRRAREH
jgi:hypothetical protein